jgi:HK97 family phage major capsid protein
MKTAYSIAAVIKAQMTETWGRISSHEFRAHKELVEQHGDCASIATSVRLPHEALRDMTASVGNAGGYLVATENAGFLPTLQPRSVVLSLGAQQHHAGRGNFTLAKGLTSVTTQWLTSETDPITETQPTMGQIASTPKILAAYTEISHQLLRQSNAEAAVRAELAGAFAAALDSAALQGTGTSGQPIGILNTSGVGTFTGGTLNRSALTNAQLDTAEANVFGASRGFVTTPAVANVLANRADTIESTTAVWRGSLHDGTVMGDRAISTKNMPVATAIYGVWPSLAVVSWGTVEIATDPFTQFGKGIVAVRMLAMLDIIAQRPSGFSVATSVS